MMSRIYKRDQALNKALEALKEDAAHSKTGYELAKSYHPLIVESGRFGTYGDYLVWAVELFKDGQVVVDRLRQLRSRLNINAVFRNRGKIGEVLVELEKINVDLEDLKRDVADFQNCMLATNIHENHQYIMVLQGTVEQVNLLENQIIGIANTKLNEINANSLNVTNLVLSVVVVVLTIITVCNQLLS
jgi:hypothetical protein